MLSPHLRRKVHDLWSLFWSSGLSNPLVAIEQITYLLFIRQLERLDQDRVKQGKPSIYSLTEEEKKERTNLMKNLRKENKGLKDSELAAKIAIPPDYEKCRWSYIRQNVSFPLLEAIVFPWLRNLENRVGAAQNGNTTLGQISGRLKDAYFILDPNKTETLKRSVSIIDDLFRQLDTRSVNSDIMGDIFEYLLEEVKEAGKNGQFRTPRHIIRFMVELLNVPLGSKVLDPACGSGGFLLNTLLHWKAEHTDPEVLRLEWDGTPHDVHPIWPRGTKVDFNSAFHGYDNDRTMVRIAWMNLLLHDVESPEIHQRDALSKRFDEPEDQSGTYDHILANPPFTGSVDESDLSEKRSRFPRTGNGSVPITTKSELLFVWLMLDLLKVGGRAAVIVPDGVLFGGTSAHVELRRQLLFENTLEAVISLPKNVFQPYSGVKTSIVIFQKAGAPTQHDSEPRTREVWFYEIADEAYTLDQRRKPRQGQENDLWDALVKFRTWHDYLAGEVKRGKSLETLRENSIATQYHQPEYWEERWRAVDDDFLKIFPKKSRDKGHTIPLHELWRDEFADFSPADPRGARQYDDAILERVRPVLEKQARKLAEKTIAHAHATAREPGAEKAQAAAEKAMKTFGTTLQKLARDRALLDREFDQFGLNALKSLLKELNAQVPDWAAVAPITAKSSKKPQFSAAPLPDRYAEDLVPQLEELAKLDGYNVWRRSGDIQELRAKLVPSEDGTLARRPTPQSWIVPVRKWADRESWGLDPKTQQPITEPTHKDGIVRADYLNWLRDTLKVFNDDATVKREHRDRLDPDCLEALDFNLSAGRHKSFVFDPGQHRAPAELIHELQTIHSEIQERLGKLLAMVEAGGTVARSRVKGAGKLPVL